MGKAKIDILIVVDMQNDFVTGTLGTPEAQAIVPKVVEKIKNWEGKVLYTRDTHYEDYLMTQEGKHLPVKHCLKNTWGWQLIDEVGATISDEYMENDNSIYDKEIFASRSLMWDLWDMQFLWPDTEISSITLIDLCTDICVLSNAIMLKNYLIDIPVIVDASCCAGVTPESHKNALNAMKMCQIEIMNYE